MIIRETHPGRMPTASWTHSPLRLVIAGLWSDPSFDPDTEAVDLCEEWKIQHDLLAELCEKICERFCQGKSVERLCQWRATRLPKANRGGKKTAMRTQTILGSTLVSMANWEKPKMD